MFGSRKASLLETWLLLLAFPGALLLPDPGRQWVAALYMMIVTEGSLEVKLPTIWTDEKQSREEAERRDRLEERRVEEKG